MLFQTLVSLCLAVGSFAAPHLGDVRSQTKEMLGVPIQLPVQVYRIPVSAGMMINEKVTSTDENLDMTMLGSSFYDQQIYRALTPNQRLRQSISFAPVFIADNYSLVDAMLIFDDKNLSKEPRRTISAYFVNKATLSRESEYFDELFNAKTVKPLRFGPKYEQFVAEGTADDFYESLLNWVHMDWKTRLSTYGPDSVIVYFDVAGDIRMRLPAVPSQKRKASRKQFELTKLNKNSIL